MDESDLQAAVLEHAKYLGLDPRRQQVHALGKKALLAPVPAPWVQYVRKASYYCNEETGESSWENPMDNVYFEKIKKIKEQDNGPLQAPCPLPSPSVPPPALPLPPLSPPASSSEEKEPLPVVSETVREKNAGDDEAEREDEDEIEKIVGKRAVGA